MTGFHHLGYWVDDLDEAVDRAVRTLGVGPFLVHRHVAFDAFTQPVAESFEATPPLALALGPVMRCRLR